MKRGAILLAAGWLVAGCASTSGLSERGQVIRQILPSTVQLRTERAGGARRAASGVVVASDPQSDRLWILTTRHVLDAAGQDQIYVTTPGRHGRVKGAVRAASQNIDLAVIEAEGLALPPVKLKDIVQLGDEVWIVAFPWGRRLTVVSGVVSQIAAEEGEAAVEGPARMVDASVSYGSSGGGVFDALTGALIGIVEGYRTARVAPPAGPERGFDVPVPGETILISSRTIINFLVASGLERLLRE